MRTGIVGCGCATEIAHSGVHCAVAVEAPAVGHTGAFGNFEVVAPEARAGGSRLFKSAARILPRYRFESVGTGHKSGRAVELIRSIVYFREVLSKDDVADTGVLHCGCVNPGERKRRGLDHVGNLDGAFRGVGYLEPVIRVLIQAAEYEAGLLAVPATVAGGDVVADYQLGAAGVFVQGYRVRLADVV